MKDYLLIIKGSIMDSASPAEMQEAVKKYQAWAASLAGQYVDGQRLETSGAMVHSRDSISTDGPFLESKEMISGYVMVKAESLEQAVAIAQGSPLLDHCGIEVRPIKIMNP